MLVSACVFIGLSNVASQSAMVHRNLSLLVKLFSILHGLRRCPCFTFNDLSK